MPAAAPTLVPSLFSLPRRTASPPDIAGIQDAVRRGGAWVEPLRREIGSVLVGQRALVDRLLVAMLAGGHVLLEGVPGLAKTLALKTLARATSAEFQRIQFTPDMLPADIVGTLIYNPRDGRFETKRGPIFANLILADEINRAPAKVQSALLEVMQERQVTIGRETYPAPDPFLVMATQNPIESEGTYPLPEAQVDRFMLKVLVGYPERDEELTVVQRSLEQAAAVRQVLTLDDLKRLQRAALDVYVDPSLISYAVTLATATREPGRHGLDAWSDYVAYGASPRGPIALVQSARALALIHGRDYVITQDLTALVKDAFRHRLVLTYQALAEEKSADDILDAVIAAVPQPQLDLRRIAAA
jgi:MoxR-like ATPase